MVGAGPAGATAALSVLRRAPATRVLLLDRDDFPRDKCCGDGVAAQAVDVLGQLGAGDVVDGWTPVEQLHLATDRRQVRGAMARPAWVVPRAVLDARIVGHAVAAGAVLRRHRVRELRVDHRTDGAVVLDGDLRASVVIGADGVRSVVRAALGSPSQGQTALAIRGYAPTLAAHRGRQVIRWGSRAQPSYAWAFDRGDGLSNVGYGELAVTPGLTRRLLLDELERLLPGAAEGAGSWRAHHLPLSGRGWGRVQPDGPVLLTGDAAGLVNPLTGEGIYYAVATGSLAGAAAVKALAADRPASAGARHRDAVRRLLDRHLRHTWAASRLARVPGVVDAGLVASGRDQGVFDDLVEVGLGDGLLTPRLVGGLALGLLS